MRAIWKYTLSTVGPDNSLDLPVGAHFRYLAMQDGAVRVWFEVQSDAPTQTRYFEWFGTGHRVSGNANYLGTLQLMGGHLVLHLHEVT